MKKTARELLGQMVDLSIKQVVHKTPGGENPIKIMHKCVFCNDEERAPSQIQHKHMCVVAQAKDYLRENP